MAEFLQLNYPGDDPGWSSDVQGYPTPPRETVKVTWDGPHVEEGDDPNPDGEKANEFVAQSMLGVARYA